MADSNYMKKQLLSMPYRDISKTFIEENFGRFYDNATGKVMEPKFQLNAKITLEKGELENVHEKTQTTIGRLLVNKFLFSDGLMHVVPYVNETITKGVIKKFETLIANALIDGKIDSKVITAYYNRIQWLGLSVHSIICGSLSEKMIYPLPEILKLKEELFKKYAEDLNGPNGLIMAAKIESILMDEAKKILKDDPGMDLYNYGAKTTFKGTYKDMMLVKGPVYNNVTKRFDIIKSCLAQGIDKNEIDSFGSQVISGAYPKAVDTRVAGYYTKKFFSCYQNVVLDEPGTDCGSQKFRDVLLTADNYSRVKYRFINDNGKLVCLTPEIAPKYYGKTVHMRSPMYCAGEKICNKCAGDLMYRLQLRNVGLTISDIGSNLLNVGMKGFHDSTVSLYKMDVNNLLM